jgi:hypothetical protein
MGHEDQFPLLGLIARCGFGQQTFAGSHRNRRDAPTAAFRRASGIDGADR